MKEAEMQAEATVDDGAGSPVPPIGFLEAWKRSWVWWTWDGRATRREYVFQRCIGLAGASVLYWVALAAMRGHFFPPWCSRWFVLYLLVKSPPWWGVTVRRLHDVGVSGWWYWLYAIPGIGGLVLDVWLLLHPGERGPNEYGLDPRLPQKPWRGLSSLP
ncbi:MAG: DUF805 domain-containing protein [Kiritimatiellae bacterium]|nr:DUF805 domain-containing protein [Kiritimatiellia bacterium]